MSPYGPPPILFRDRRWSGREISSIALAWREALGEEFSASSDPAAMVMANHLEAVALFFALSSCCAPVILLPSDPRGWRTRPPIPSGTRMVLPPAFAHLESEAACLGLHVTVLPEVDEAACPPEVPFMTCPGFVILTSGSTGLPRPAYRRTATLLQASAARVAALGFPARAGVIAVLPLDRPQGLMYLMAATVLGRPVGLLEHFRHNALLTLFASGEYHHWAGTPVMADILNRSVLAGPHPAPPICVLAGRLPASMCRAFEARFGIPLRQEYGATEALVVTVDGGPGSEVRSQTAGRPLPGVGVHVGDDPRVPCLVGEPGRIWVSSPWLMEGYGFPPEVEPVATVEGWWPSPDIGQLDDDGYLTILGRLDDCIRTGAGHLVSPAEVAAALEGHPGVTDAAVVPLEASAGPVLGVLVQSAQALQPDDVRRHLARSLPPWAQPRVLEVTRELPRLPSGRTDRRACIAILEKALPLQRRHADPAAP